MTTAPHPITATLARLAELREDNQDWLLTKVDSEEGWFSAADLAADPPRLQDALTRISQHYQVKSLRPAAALWFGLYAYVMEAVAYACFLFECRLPDLSPGKISLLLGESGYVSRVAWRGRTFAALSDDPDASHPDCIPFPTRESMRQHLREQLTAGFAPLIDAVSGQSSFGKPGLWALAADYNAYALTWLGELMGNETIGVEESRAFSAVKTPLSTKRDFIPIDHIGTTHYLLERTSCCLYYKVEGGGYCASCPHRSMDERIELAKKHMEEEAAGVVG